jgi:hypothetical protein
MVPTLLDVMSRNVAEVYWEKCCKDSCLKGWGDDDDDNNNNNVMQKETEKKLYTR